MTEEPGMHRYQRFFAELKRRKVFRAIAMYGAVAFVVLQAGEILVEGLGLPTSVLRTIIILTMIGFPITLGLAWALEMRPQLGGLRLTDPPDEGEIDEIVGQPRSKRWPSGLLALAGVVLLAVGVALMTNRLQSGEFEVASRDGGTVAGAVDLATPVAGTVLAVHPFGVQGSDEVAYLGEGLVSLLGTKLDGAGDLRTVDAHAILQMVEREGLEAGDRVAGGRIADAFGASHYVVGDIFEAGGRIQIDASLHETGRREAVVEASVDGTEDEMFAMVDDLTAQLLSGMAGGAATRVRQIAAVTTESLPALKAFFEGDEQFRQGKFTASQQSFERAIAEDSTFGLAYYRLATVAEWSLQIELSQWATAQTERHIDRLSERDRRMLEAFLARKRGENLRAAESYLSILGTHPDEMEAWLDLAEVQFHAYPLYGRSISESRPTLEKVLELDPEHSAALIHLARLSAHEGKPNEVVSFVEGMSALSDRSLEMDLLRALATGDSAELAAAEARFTTEPEDGLALTITSALLTRRFDVLEKIYRELTRPTRSVAARRMGHQWLANLAIAEGRWADAMSEIGILSASSPAAALEHQAMLYLAPFAPVTDADLGQLADRLERFDPATAEMSNATSALFNAHDQMHPALRAYLLGKVRARLGQADAALAEAQALDSMAIPAQFGSLAPDLARGIRAEVHRAQGRSAAALAEIESMDAHMWYLLIVASPVSAYAPERYARSELLIEAGRYDEAEEWLAELGVFASPELPWYSAAQFLRAEVAERLGDMEAASTHRATFDRMWRDADDSMRARLP